MAQSKLTWQWGVYKFTDLVDELRGEYRGKYVVLETCESFNVEDHAIRWLEEHAELGKEYTIIKIYKLL